MVFLQIKIFLRKLSGPPLFVAGVLSSSASAFLFPVLVAVPGLIWVGHGLEAFDGPMPVIFERIQCRVDSRERGGGRLLFAWRALNWRRFWYW